ncbi:muconolactone Delta-isomerase family protein [Amycolatopsis ultiminotia]|uniref:Muconolactone Delta-isomerase family protein n=1 Tax=Amycolatopsis ultiminotia TaxID=543629 RepID=A0ABP6W0V1_9PSEU
MDFLVRVDATGVYELPETERLDLIERERARGLELMAENVIREFWRLPGTKANLGIWTAKDADALEAALVSLPVHPYARIEVTALATHPMTRMRQATR